MKAMHVASAHRQVTSLGKGIAFVGFESEEAAQAALAAHDTSLEGAAGRIAVPLCSIGACCATCSHTSRIS